MNNCEYCGKDSHWKLLIPNLLCWLIEYQKPNWIWNNNVGCSILYWLHELTCIDTRLFEIRNNYNIKLHKFKLI